MRRQRRTHHTDDMDNDDYQPTNLTRYTQLKGAADSMEDLMQLERLPRSGNAALANRFQNTIEAKVEVGDTLQALALRFHCTVADIKRLNKIDKENEIHARKVVKIPVTAHSVLLETLPTVHKSGNSSPRSTDPIGMEPNITRNPLEDARTMLSEKLMVASVNASGNNSNSNGDRDLNTAILNSKVSPNVYTDENPHVSTAVTGSTLTPLLDDMFDDEIIDARVRPIRGPSLRAIDWSGSDCDMSWACLFVVILALCFAIPLIIVIFFTPHQHSTHSASH